MEWLTVILLHWIPITFTKTIIFGEYHHLLTIFFARVQDIQ
jgi:hypothetical protein